MRNLRAELPAKTAIVYLGFTRKQHRSSISYHTKLLWSLVWYISTTTQCTLCGRPIRRFSAHRCWMTSRIRCFCPL